MRKLLGPIILALGLVLTITFSVLYNYQLVGSDAPGCRPVRMAPSYARILGFDETYTKYASKYSLYLYRELGKDLKPTKKNGFRLEGTPALFIPGNAGSYRQIRSIASKISNIIADKLYDGLNDKYGKIDFFTADFNEDFTAFHGRTMLDQAEYLNEVVKFILGLYQDSEVPPKSVIIVGHSMGGIVARVMPTLPNYQKQSINTILTLSTPHSRSPLTFDRDIMNIYRAINEFWHAGFYDTENSQLGEVASSVLEDVLLVSIAGGLLDSVVPADYATLQDIVPPDHGFTTFSSGIPGVWTSIDHLAIVWCDQLRTVILNALLDVVDVTLEKKVVSLSNRMALFRNRFLTGFEGIEPPRSSVKLTFDDSQINYARSNQKIKISKAGINVFKINTNETFLLLARESSTSLLYVCNDNIDTEKELDMTHKNTKKLAVFSCLDVSSALTMIPQFEGVDSLKESSIGGDKPPLYSAKLNPAFLSDYDHIVVLDIESIAEMKTLAEIEIVPGLTGGTFDIPLDLSTTIRLKGVKSSLKSYDLIFDTQVNLLTRQFINEETKWHISNNINLNFHGQSPYMGPVLEDLRLEIWTTNMEDDVYEVIVKPNFWVSLKLLIIRYRIAIVGYGLLVNLIVFGLQLREFDRSKKFVAYGKALEKLLTLEYLRYLIVFPVLEVVNQTRLGKYLISQIHFESPGPNGLDIGGAVGLHLVFLILSVFFNFIISVAISQFVRLRSLILPPKTTNKTRNIVLGMLLVLTVVYLPYQVAYMILTIAQVIKLLKLKSDNEVNFNVTFLMMMIWIVPINIPIIVVLVHNLTVNWKTTFSSHHNILSILPILYMVSFKEQIRFKYTNVIVAYLVYMGSYCILYGNINTFWLYQLFNYFCIGLIVIDSQWIHA